jgi:integrase
MGKVVTLPQSAAVGMAAPKRKPAPVKLTKRVVEEIEPNPHGAERLVWDSQLKGFGVRVQSSGIRTYIIQYRDLAGRSRRMKIDRHGVCTTEQARAKAVQLLAVVGCGENPSVERRAVRAKAKQTRTVKELIERFLRDHVEAKRKPGTAREYRRVLETRVIPVFGSRSVDDVTREDVEALHLQMRGSPDEANRTLAVLSKMFNMAEGWGLRPLQSNPCYRIERYREHKRDRFYSDEELKRIGTALIAAERDRSIPAGAITALRLLAFTGCRAGEIASLRWQDVDLDAGVLRLPDAKAGVRSVPLGAPAIELLRSLPRQPPLVANGRKPGTPLTMPALQAAWKKIRTAAGLSNARLHDLRHTVGTVRRAGRSKRVHGARHPRPQAVSHDRSVRVERHQPAQARRRRRLRAGCRGAARRVSGAGLLTAT